MRQNKIIVANENSPFFFSELAIQPNLNSVLVPPHARNASDPGAVTGDTNLGTDGGTTQGATAATEQPV